MNCSKCGVNNFDEANYCRRCGNRLRRPLTDPLPEVTPYDQARAIRKLLIGIGLLVAAFIPLLEGEPMIWWLIFPGLPLLANGIRQLTPFRIADCVSQQPFATTPFNRIAKTDSPLSDSNRAKATSELVPPASITETTTKLFDRQ